MFIQSARRSAIRRTGRLSHSTAASPTSPSSRCAAFDKRPSATKSVVVRGLLRSSGRVLGGAAGGNNDIGPYWEVDGSLGGVVGRVSPGNPSTMAFLGVRAKSTSAAFSTQLQADDADDEYSSGRSHREDWMINLGRNGDNEWLTGDRPIDWYTGMHPLDCPGVDANGTLRSLPLPNLSRVTRESARRYFDNSWTLYEMLFAGLRGDEPFYRPPVHGLRHPQIFYYGHTPCLYVNKLRVSGVLDGPVNAYFESIFEVGVDEMLWDDMHKNDMLWPAVSEVFEYRKDVYNTVVDAIMNHPSLDDSNGPVTVNQDHPMWALFMGFEHERIHLETSSVLFRETPIELVQRPKHWPSLHPSVYDGVSRSTNPVEGEDYPSNEMIGVQGRTVKLGKPLDFPSYGWDNEYGDRTVDVPNFSASKHMVTNGEYFDFVKAGGYRRKEYWCEDGWAWRSHRNMKWPFFWTAVGPAGSHEYGLRAIYEEIPMQWDWPADVTYYESRAYCLWKSERDGPPKKGPLRVLTEAEHNVIRHQDHNLDAARSNVDADKVMVTSGSDFPKGSTGANLNMAYSSQNPVNFFPPSHTGHFDTVGNAWEWTEDHFNPLKNFEAHHIYDDFSAPCFDGKHSMIVGGSFMSTGDEASVFARFHFRPHFLQHSGFRLVSSDEEAPATHLFPGNFSGQAAKAAAEADCDAEIAEETSSNVYETDDLMSMYLGLHFPLSGSREGVDPVIEHVAAPLHGLRFPQRIANLLTALKPAKLERALDVGCAVGGASFELAKSFDHVEAFDFSDNFVSAAKRIQSGEQLTFEVPIEGDISKQVSVVQEDGVDHSVMSRVNFFQGDACSLGTYAETRNEFKGGFDGVILSNLLCRLPDPEATLVALPNIVNKGGVVVIVTPFTWLEEFTNRAKWLGGVIDPVSKQPIHSKDVLRTIMEEQGFEKIHEEQMPLVIREHRRKYQYIVSEASGWRKK